MKYMISMALKQLCSAMHCAVTVGLLVALLPPNLLAQIDQTNVSVTAICAESSVPVSYTVANPANSGNIFSAQLSDATGSFASPITIGSLTSTSSGTISAAIPTATPAGSLYRIRVVSSSPATIGPDNLTNITINPLPGAAGAITGATTVCQGQNALSYSVPPISNASGYVWSIPSGATIASGGNSNSITVNYSTTAATGNILVAGTNSCGSGAISAAPGAIDQSFNTIDNGFGNAAGAQVNSSILQPDGKIIIGGNFITYNGATRNYIARLNADGTLDATFNPGVGANNLIYTTALQPDGKIIIGGDFTNYNGLNRNRIARLNADGTLDVTFNPSAGANGTILSTTVQPDGKLIIGGLFTNYNGTSRNYIARLNADGNLDATFNPGTGASGAVQSISLQPNGKIIIGGDFTTYNGTARNYVASLNADGTLDPTFNPGTGSNNTVQTISIQPDGKIIIGGNFTAYNGTARSRIARVNTDGTLDATFNPGVGANNKVFTSYLQSNGKIMIGGDFTTFNGATRNRIARLNADGTADVTFSPPGIGAISTVRTTFTQPDDRIIIGGSFFNYGGTARNYIARLNTDGLLDSSFNIVTGADNGVYTTILQPDGKILIGGYFTNYNSTFRKNIARLNSDGTLDTTFNPGTGANADVQTATLQPDGRFIIGGTFSSYNGTARSYIARVNADGNLDATFNPGTGANNVVRTTALQTDGKILIGGDFTTLNGTARSRIARLNADGTVDATFNPGTGASSSVYCTVSQPDGKIIIGGLFTTFNDTARNRIARLNADGTLDATFNPSTGVNSIVRDILLQPDGKIIIVGDFTTYNGNIKNHIARLNADGSLDPTFNSGTGFNNPVFTAILQPDGKIIIGGFFDFYNGIDRYCITRLNADGTLDTTFNPGTGARTSVYAIALQPDGKIIIGGDFTIYNGNGKNRIARVHGSGLTVTVNVATTWHLDADGDGYSVNGSSVSTCVSPGEGYTSTTLGNDCNDTNASIWQSGTFYTDTDGDGYHGSEATICYGNTIPSGSTTTLGLDCNDSNNAVNPLATEVCGDALDNDCDGSIDEGCASGNNFPAYASNVVYSSNMNFPNCFIISGDLNGASDSPESPEFSGPDEWYKFTAISTAVSITLSSSGQDDAIALYTKSGTNYILVASENAVTDNGDFERLNQGGLTPGAQYYISVGAAAGTTGGAYSLCIQNLTQSDCALSIPATGFNLCNTFKALYRGGSSQGVTYNFYFTGVGGGAIGQTVASGSNLVTLSNPDLYIRYGGIYDVLVNVDYALQDGAGNTEIVFVAGDSSTANCNNVTIMAQPLVEVRSNQRCPSSLYRGTYLNASRIGTASLCGAINYTYEFTQVVSCSDGTTVSLQPVLFTGTGSAPYLRLTVLPNLGNTGAWDVRVRPNFMFGEGVFGTMQRIQVIGTSASGEVLYEVVDAEKEVDAEMESASVYPNPSNGESVTIALPDLNKGMLQVRVLDAAGRVVNARAYAAEGTFNTTLTFEEKLSAGVYIIEMMNEGQLQTQRFEVQ